MLAIAALAAAGAAGGDRTSRHESVPARLSVSVPAGWHVLRGWLSDVTDPAPRLAVGSFPARLSRHTCECGFPNVVDFPRDGAFIFVWEYLHPAHRGLARVPKPPRGLPSCGRRWIAPNVRWIERHVRLQGRGARLPGGGLPRAPSQASAPRAGGGDARQPARSGRLTYRLPWGGHAGDAARSPRAVAARGCKAGEIRSVHGRPARAREARLTPAMTGTVARRALSEGLSATPCSIPAAHCPSSGARPTCFPRGRWSAGSEGSAATTSSFCRWSGSRRRSC